MLHTGSMCLLQRRALVWARGCDREGGGSARVAGGTTPPCRVRAPLLGEQQGRAPHATSAAERGIQVACTRAGPLRTSPMGFSIFWYLPRPVYVAMVLELNGQENNTLRCQAASTRQKASACTA